MGMEIDSVSKVHGVPTWRDIFTTSLLVDTPTQNTCARSANECCIVAPVRGGRADCQTLPHRNVTSKSSNQTTTSVGAVSATNTLRKAIPMWMPAPNASPERYAASAWARSVKIFSPSPTMWATISCFEWFCLTADMMDLKCASSTLQTGLLRAALTPALNSSREFVI